MNHCSPTVGMITAKPLWFLETHPEYHLEWAKNRLDLLEKSISGSFCLDIDKHKQHVPEINKAIQELKDYINGRTEKVHYVKTSK